MTLSSRPATFPATVAVIAVAALWGFIRLVAFSDRPMHLTFVIPLFIVIWTRRYWHLWMLAGIFTVITFIKVWWVLPPGVLDAMGETIYFLTTMINIIVGTGLFTFVLFLFKRLETHKQSLTAQNIELEKLSAALNHQNEEVTAQAEELSQQNEEMEAQSEELAAQNEELQETNARLGRREEVLQNLLQFSGNPDDAKKSFQDICQRTLIIIGAPATAVAIIESDQNGTVIVDHARAANAPALPLEWSFEDNLLDLVCREKKTAYVSDLLERPDLAKPFSRASGYRSIIATPIGISNGHRCALVACSPSVSHWSDDQFKVLEWLSAQCALFMDSIRLQNAIKERAAELESANKAKDQFFAMLSHELRTPLTPVLAAVGVLSQDNRVPEDIHADLEMIRRNVRIQSRLIDDLLDLARISQGKIDLEWQMLPVAGLLKHTLQIVAPDLDAKNQILNVEFEGLDGLQVRADGARLQQVYWNLLKNAVKFSPVGSHIDLTAGVTSNREIQVSIRDRGRGLSEADMERIFLPFEQVHEAVPRNNHGGLGLGLAIAKAVIDLHGGRITVSSEGEGKGSCFSVFLPVAETPEVRSSPAEQEPQASAKSAVRGGVVNVLVVEDHADTGLILTRILQSMGYNPSYAATATEAYQLFENRPFELVISDLGLPDESGLELMRKLKAAKPEIYGICLSGFGMEEDRQACKEAGFSEHLTKPVEIASLESAIQNISRLIQA